MIVGAKVGSDVGSSVKIVGAKVGSDVGSSVEIVGANVGSDVGSSVGISDGAIVGGIILIKFMTVIVKDE